MTSSYLFFLLVLLATAAVVRGDFVFTVIYLFVGAMVAGHWWSGRAMKTVKLRRVFEPRAFLGEDVPVRLEIHNHSLLPVVWVRVHDGLPLELAAHNTVNRVVTLGPRGRAHLEYVLHARKRGFYPIGPLSISSGDLLGLAAPRKREEALDSLTVYPLIVPLTHVNLPSRSPQGTLRHTQPVFEDPTRVLSKRDYVAGDSLRRVDWKASAAVGRLQVKQFEPSIALHTVIFLNLNANEYAWNARLDAAELGIVIAASLANWVTARKQTLGLVSNGLDPLGSLEDSPSGEAEAPLQRLERIPGGKGRGHLMRILDVLARIQPAESVSLVDVLRQESPRLPWGATLVLITGQADEALFDQLFQARRRGQNVVLVIAGRVPGGQEIRQRAQAFGFAVYLFQTESDLDVWRR